MPLSKCLKEHVEAVSVSEQEIQQIYGERQRDFQGFLEPEVKYRIRRDLEDQKRAEALEKLVSSLREKATVEVYWQNRFIRNWPRCLLG